MLEPLPFVYVANLFFLVVAVRQQTVPPFLIVPKFSEPGSYRGDSDEFITPDIAFFSN